MNIQPPDIVPIQSQSSTKNVTSHKRQQELIRDHNFLVHKTETEDNVRSANYSPHSHLHPCRHGSRLGGRVFEQPLQRPCPVSQV